MHVQHSWRELSIHWYSSMIYICAAVYIPQPPPPPVDPLVVDDDDAVFHADELVAPNENCAPPYFIQYTLIKMNDVWYYLLYRATSSRLSATETE